MSSRKLIVGLIVVLVVFWAACLVYSDQTESPKPPPMHLMAGLSGICGDGDGLYLYVMAGGKILQYEIATMQLINSVDLPKPALPRSAPPAAIQPGQLPPHPPMAAPHGLWIRDDLLYVLAGPVIHRYSIPDLILGNSTELPRPDPPQTEE